MKTSSLSLLTALALAGTILAQGPLHTGVVQKLSKEDGTLTLQSTQSGVGAIVYHGMDKAQILTVSGKPATLADIGTGAQITVFYAKTGDQWVVSKVLVPDPVLPTLAPALPAVTSRAAVDGDRTTRPASADPARDGDRTTQPGSKALTDLDRTTQPGSKAATDLDRTTQPGSKAATDLDRTTKPDGISGNDGDRTTRPAR